VIVSRVKRIGRMGDCLLWVVSLKITEVAHIL
jgi:hypothetical protein